MWISKKDYEIWNNKITEFKNDFWKERRTVYKLLNNYRYLNKKNIDLLSKNRDLEIALKKANKLTERLLKILEKAKK